MHITTAARLYNRTVDAYKPLIKKAMEDEDLVVRVYEPLRYAVVAEAREAGKGESVLRRMLPRLDKLKNAEVLKANNVAAFQRYCDKFSSLWPGFVEHYLDTTKRLAPVAVGDFTFSGRFHFCARNLKGNLDYVYVSGSDLDQDAITAMREFLAIIGTDRHEGNRNQAVLLDLHSGIAYRPNTNFLRIRGKLESVLQMGSLIEKEYRRP